LLAKAKGDRVRDRHQRVAAEEARDTALKQLALEQKVKKRAHANAELDRDHALRERDKATDRVLVVEVSVCARAIVHTHTQHIYTSIHTQHSTHAHTQALLAKAKDARVGDRHLRVAAESERNETELQLRQVRIILGAAESTVTMLKVRSCAHP
jgi:hypothetical protein